MATSIVDEPLRYRDRDSMLYALGVGFSGNCGDRKELPYTYEEPALKTVPTMASVLVPLDFPAENGWSPGEASLTEQRLELYRPLPAAAELIANRRVIEVCREDENHASILLQSDVRMAKDDTALFMLHSTFVARDDGRFGGGQGKATERHHLPERMPDLSCASATGEDQALLFRLSGDRDPLYASPEQARQAGYPRPLLQGRCVYGIACRAILKTICDYDHTLITGFDAAFLGQAFPGDTLTTDMWQERNIVSFRCSVKGRNSIVISNGKCTLAA